MQRVSEAVLIDRAAALWHRVSRCKYVVSAMRLPGVCLLMVAVAHFCSATTHIRNAVVMSVASFLWLSDDRLLLRRSATAPLPSKAAHQLQLPRVFPSSLCTPSRGCVSVGLSGYLESSQ